MQVELNADGDARNGTLTLSAPGALTTIVELRGQSTFVAPLLMLSDDADRLSWSFNGSAPRQLATPLTAIAPQDGMSALRGANAFAPTLAWNPGASKRVRRITILTSVLLALLILGSVTLLRGRKAVAGVFACVALGAAGLEIGRRAVSPIWRAEGQVIVVSADGVAQFDTWQYITSRATSDITVEIPQGATPVFVDARHARDAHASLHCDAARNILSMRCTLRPQMKVALQQRRTTRAASPLPSTQPISRALRSPMGELARRDYVDRDTRIVDEGSVEWTDDQLVHWASVILYNSGEH